MTTRAERERLETRAISKGWRYVSGYWVLGTVVLRGIPRYD